MKRFLIPIGIIAAIALIVLSGVLGYFSVNSSFAIPVSLPSIQQTTPTPQVRTAGVTRGDVRQVLTVPGEVVPANTQQLSFSATGRLVELNVRVGDAVTQGKVLYHLLTWQKDRFRRRFTTRLLFSVVRVIVRRRGLLIPMDRIWRNSATARITTLPPRETPSLPTERICSTMRLTRIKFSKSGVPISNRRARRRSK